MGLSFGEAHGSAQKTGLEYYKFEMGINKFRMVGELRPRYAYWKELKTNSIPVECLSFDPAEEKFTNVEKDWFKHYFPEEKCVWSYVVQVINEDNKLVLCGLKKKLFDQIQTAAKSLGDPTDPETGWTVIVDKKKTGPNRFNIEYELMQLELDKAPLTPEQAEAAEEVKPIDELLPRMTPQEQKNFIESAWVNAQQEEEAVDKEVADEFAAMEGTDKKPF